MEDRLSVAMSKAHTPLLLPACFKTGLSVDLQRETPACPFPLATWGQTLPMGSFLRQHKYELRRGKKIYKMLRDRSCSPSLTVSEAPDQT